jgi:NitT/TauT family transport system substrate-binding protein
MKKLFLVLTFMLLFVLQAFVGADAAELKKFKVGYLPSTGHLMYFVAQEKGFFKEEGLDVELFRFTNSGEGLTALKAGKLDAGSFGTAPPLLFISKGADFIIFGGQMGEGHGLIAKPENADRFKSLKNWKGSTIGVVKISTGDIVFRAALNEAGVNWKKDLTIREFDSPAAVLEAVKKGAVDAGLVWIPYFTLAEKQGLKAVIFSGDVIKHHSCCRQVALASTIQERKSDFDRFMVALIRAYKFYRQNPQETVAITSKYVTLDKDLLMKDIYESGHLQINPDPHKKSVLQFWDFMNKIEYINSKEKIDRRVNTSIYQTALNTVLKREPKEKIYGDLNKEFKSGGEAIHIKHH